MTALAKKTEPLSQELSLVEQVVMQGDLSKLNAEQRVSYYKQVCESTGLNPLTRPFDYIQLNGKLTLYAKKDATEQLRKLNGISIEKLESQIIDDLYIVKATARTKDGRTDAATGAVTIGGLKGDHKANAIMKAETKAKRRVTLSISGMGWTDETEIESIPNAKPVSVDLETGEINATIAIVPKVETAQKIRKEQLDDINKLLGECSQNYRDWVKTYVKNQYKIEDFADLTVDIYTNMRPAVLKNAQKKVELKEVETK